MPGLRMVFSNGDETTTFRVVGEVSVEPIARRSDWPGNSVGRVLFFRPGVNSLVLKIRKVNHPARDDERPARRIVHARAHVEARRRQIDRASVGTSPHQHTPPAFVRPPLEPINRVAIDRHAAEADSLLSN